MSRKLLACDHSQTGILRYMKRHILIYGLVGGLSIVLLKLIEYRFLVIEHSIEIYGGLIALFFAGFGIWLGLRLTRTKEKVIIREVPVNPPAGFTLNESRLRELGIDWVEVKMIEIDPASDAYEPAYVFTLFYQGKGVERLHIN